ncbi:transporter substrate-binding domain-containing protein [Neiella marina]|uniref:Transporter substrate-binding domain-containing protein n=1 Tax=Neiella holothuriorum TaxID=2870530 RepID=A0ABS7ECX1_9GAMM|nr:transporter substrate-binding domain-containing protein [Neiella holothuriorum]MBW8190165.1 transporter substrate-binding domain-containing protein [Neiella holothuriorum]
MVRLFALVVVVLLLCPRGHAQSQIVYFQSHERFNYDIELLQHLLNITANDYGPSQASPLNDQLTEQQGLRALTRGAVDIAFLPTSKRREANYQAIKQPLLQGMLGYRLLLTTESSDSKFKTITDLKQLREKAIAGFGLHWEDLRILYRNRLPVMTSPQYQELFSMLSSGQIDYLPRGLNEIQLELVEQSKIHDQLKINQDIALFYVFPRYFFVNRSNTELAERLLAGFALALEDGSFKALFDKHFGQIASQIASHPRALIKLNNPFLPEQIPPMQTDWWLSPHAVNQLAGKGNAHSGQ